MARAPKAKEEANVKNTELENEEVENTQEQEVPKKPVKKGTTFMHVSNPYFYFVNGKVRCQFTKSLYTTENPVEIKMLTEYMYNTNDLLIRE